MMPTDSKNPRPEPISMSDKQHHKRLTTQIVMAIGAAILLALMLPTLLNLVGLGESASVVLTPLVIGGEIFLRLLKMVVVPLVVTSVMSGVLGLGDIRKLGRPGLVAVVYYLTTTILAVIVGLILVNVIRPGLMVDKDLSGGFREQMAVEEEAAKAVPLEGPLAAVEDDRPKSAGDILKNLILMLFSDNLLGSAANGDLLPLIVFSMVFAGILSTMGDRVGTLVGFIKQGNDALLQLIMLIMRFAPLGIFCLVAAKFGTAMADGEFLQTLRKIGAYFFTVVIGLAIHALITLPTILYVTTGRNPYRFILQISEALLTAFSTASSSATLPVTIEKTIDEAGVSRKSVDFVVPLGSTINMDGTALYEAVAAIFIAQVLGMDLSLSGQIIVAVTATLAAIGAAGIPEAGLVTMQIVLTSVGLPTQGIDLIVTIDWFLDRFRTTVNVLGDAMGAAVVDRFFDKTPDVPSAPVPAAATAVPPPSNA